MEKTPRSLRIHIGLFGRTNVGKSTLLNLIAGQDVSITSPEAGTTTDTVEKTMELLPVGPVVFHDTAGLDDLSNLSSRRIERTRRSFSRVEVALIVTDEGIWGEYEKEAVRRARQHHCTVIIVSNLKGPQPPDSESLGYLRQASGTDQVIPVRAIDLSQRDLFLGELKRALISLLPADHLNPPALIGDLLPSEGHALFIIPIDSEAPKGRIILPQVQTLRDALDHDQIVTVVKEHQYQQALQSFKRPPDLVVCDSQVVDLMIEMTPEEVPCTTFSTLFARLKGDLDTLIDGVRTIDGLKKGDRILIAEACSHHAADDDIGRVKIPLWLEEYLGFAPEITVVSGRDYPADIQEYSLIIHCGACMLTRKEVLQRIERAMGKGVPITNYGICISYLRAVLDRILTPFTTGYETAYHQEERA